ncbi:G-protein coupled receptor Mth2-like [Vespula maculifrons]|uniref:G-protein coupled receptor Mth2-like n=1 Tax=Vespula maculifrons TaxID=7453 RepID=A0ABD2B456_VESMC
MHVRCTVRLLFTSFLFFVENIAAPIRPSTKWNGYHRIDLPKKCCIEGYLFNDELTCVKVIEDNNFSKEMETEVRAYGVSCEKDVAMWMEERGPNDSWTYATVDVPNDYCLEMMTNGTQVLARCPDLLKMNDNSSTANSIVSTTTTTTTTRTVYNERKTICDNKNRTKKLEAIFWGAKTYMLTNIAHMILCIVVVVTYLSVPELRKGVYNHAVLRHNISLLGLGSILTFLSYCQYPLDDNLTILLWLLLQYFTLATVFWLNVICFDMTLCITRFRWTVGLGANNERDKYRRLLLYGVFAWGGALLPTVVAGIFEYTPGIPKNFPLKPNYVRYCLGPNPTHQDSDEKSKQRTHQEIFPISKALSLDGCTLVLRYSLSLSQQTRHIKDLSSHPAHTMALHVVSTEEYPTKDRRQILLLRLIRGS